MGILVCISLVQLWGINRFNSMQWLVVIQKRYPGLVVAEAWIEFIALFIGYPLVTKDFIAPKYIIEYPSSINKMIGFAMTYSILIIELTRLYLMAFDLHFLYHSQNQKWQRSFDISFADDNRNWFLKNKKKYGNKQKVTKAMIAYILLSIVLVSISYVIVSENVSRFIAICLISICPLISLLICFKIRKYANLNDNMLFFFELKATAIIWIFSALSLRHWLLRCYQQSIFHTKSD